MELKLYPIAAFLLFAFLDGFKDAYFFHYEILVDPIKKPLHALLTAHRWIFGALIAWITLDWMFCLSLVLLFPLIHDGVYYQYRHKLTPSIYPLGWRDDSDTDRSWLNISFFFRISFAMAGIVLLIADLVIY